MQISIDTESTREWQATISKALGCLDFAKKCVERTKEAEEWPEVEYNATSIEHAMEPVFEYLEHLLDDMHEAERRGLLS